MENTCFFVSSRGILKSCTIHNTIPNSSDTRLDVNYKNIKKNDIVYVCTSAIKNFFEIIFPLIREPFILVTGDSDLSPYHIYVDDKKILHWFAQNLLHNHEKMTHIPIGLDYHTIKPNEQHPWIYGTGMNPKQQEEQLLEYKIHARPITQRLIGCYANFHHAAWGIGERGDRKEVVEKVRKDIVFYEREFEKREVCWDHQSKFMFVLSPRGGGYDCHRTWEALVLGCIPIVKTSGLDPLYEDLPVCIVESWSDITTEYLQKYLDSLKDKRFNYDKLSLKYWVDLFESKKIK